MKRKYLFAGTVLLIAVLAFSLGRVGAKSVFTKVIDSSFKGMPGGVLIKESGSIGERVVQGAYVLVENQLTETPTETVSITINKGKENEYTFNLVKVKKDNKVVSVLPDKEGGPLNLFVGREKMLFTDQYQKSLWVADLSTFEPRNLQPEVVDNISQHDLHLKKNELSKQGKDTDEYVLYWAGAPVLSPDENKIAFVSNRLGYPENCNLSLWLTDLQGNTRLLVDETDNGSVTPLTWANNEELVYQGTNGELKSVNTNTGKTGILVDQKVSVRIFSPGGKYIIYNPVQAGNVKPEIYLFNYEDKHSSLITIPNGFRINGFYSWDESYNKVAFYVSDFSDFTGNLKLVIVDCSSLAVSVLDPPDGTSFDPEIVPSWVEGELVFVAGGKLYTYLAR